MVGTPVLQHFLLSWVGQTAGTMPKSTSCISKTSMKMMDLLDTCAIVDDNFETLFIEKTCASLTHGDQHHF